ncbi:hypothetical protein [Streptomyces sp. CB02400]|uniref:hypothetical protein n=1 Tax=Streptomyces sp. CB02400 TaxID=1703944 RepID=UPI001F30F99C|nr:hypothetical protein [Streptomyces sp. CB02400]
MSEAPETPEVAAPETPEVAASDAPRKRRRGRTAVLIAAAAVLGVVAGTCTGYLVQADREPTRLPPLSQPVLAQSKGKAPEPLSADRDRRVKTDGDLRELLLKKPRGTREPDWPTGEDGWMDLAEYAGNYEESGSMFGQLAMDEFRRAAVVGWLDDDDYSVEIRLVQFRQEGHRAAAGNVENSQYWADDAEDTDSWALPGTGEGRAYVHNDPYTEPGYEPLYSAEAHAWRGDISMEIWVYGIKPVPKKMIMDLAERQMERL